MSEAQQLLQFLRSSPTPFHATATMAAMLSAKGFAELDEKDAWTLAPGGKYFCTRSGSSIIAFIVGEKPIEDTGARLVGTHTDSPCLKVKPQPEKWVKGYAQLGVETYGGVLLNPWFDRDLSLAGKVNYLDSQGELQRALVDFQTAIATVPSLAIHLDREANNGRAVNPQTQMNAVLGQTDEPFSFREMLKNKLLADGVSDVAEVLDYNMSFYDTQPPALVGLNEEFVVSARLDNLLSCFVAMQALADSDTEYTSIVVCNDHEEVGSNTEVGAQGTMVDDVLNRLIHQSESRQRAVRKSLFLSVDNAHGVHPNFVSKHDDNHGPLLNAGPVIKFDANQSYATSSDTSAFLRTLALKSADPVPLQTFVTRADMRCGSTIGPYTSASLGIKTVDIGVPTFGMHSIRETAGSKDVSYLYRLISAFYREANTAI